MTGSHPTVSRAPLLRGLGLLLLLAWAAALGACSTTQGFGKDVENLGGAIEGSAERNK